MKKTEYYATNDLDEKTLKAGTACAVRNNVFDVKFSTPFPMVEEVFRRLSLYMNH
jgi:hypothetical protein